MIEVLEMPTWPIATTLRFGSACLLLALVLVAGLPPVRAVAGDETLRIDSPVDGASVSGRIEIHGRAVARPPEAFDFYRLYFGPGRDPATLRPVGNAYSEPVMDGVLATADTSRVAAGTYLLMLRVYDIHGATTETTIHVVVASQAAPTPFATMTAIEPAVDDPGPLPVDSEANPPAQAPPSDPGSPQQLVPVILPDFSAPALAPAGLPQIDAPTPNPIYPISNPGAPPSNQIGPTGPLGPGELDPGRMPGAPPAVYLTPVP